MTGPVPAHCKVCRGECLKSVEFLVGLPPEKVTTLLRRSVRLKLAKGEYLFHEGEPCDAIYIIHQGRVKLCTYDQDAWNGSPGSLWSMIPSGKGYWCRTAGIPPRPLP